MIKNLILLFLLISPAVKAFSQIPDCGKFRDGKYRMADTRAGAVIIAERNSLYQTETSEVLKAVVRFKISWQDNCSYTLKLDKVIRNENKINFPPDLKIIVKIIETTASGYTQETSSSITNDTYKVVVTKIN